MDKPTDGKIKADILVVDDTPENLALLNQMLTERGYKVRSVTKGTTALRGAQAAPPDLILLDVKMPQMDGYEVCQHLKADDRTR
ncbi:MAG: response regulator, partial [Xenococcaceae cyanobacterium]